MSGPFPKGAPAGAALLELQLGVERRGLLRFGKLLIRLADEMLEKPIDEITREDLESLIENEVAEQKTLEYKQELPGDTDSEKKEFLADVSSFANANGGDIIYGIAEQNGVPKELVGLDVENMDQTILRLEQIIRAGIEPRIHNIEVRPVKLSGSKYALIIRIPKSYVGPHWVKFKEHYKFYSRSTKGKYRMDLTELRIAFTLSERIVEKARDFRLHRVNQIQNGETCLPIKEGAKVVFHLVPYSAFYPGKRYDLSKFFLFKREKGSNSPGLGGRDRYNFDGILSYSGPFEGTPDFYLQVFKNGIIEMTNAHLLAPENGNLLIPGLLFEKTMIESFATYLKLYKTLGVEPPVFVFLTLIQVKGYRMSVEDFLRQNDFYLSFCNESCSIDRDNLLVPEVFIETYDIDPAEALRPCFDSIWNACGFPRSLNYDDHGEWMGHKGRMET